MTKNFATAAAGLPVSEGLRKNMVARFLLRGE